MTFSRFMKRCLGVGLVALPWVVTGFTVYPASATSLEEAVRAGLTNPEVREAAASRRALVHDLREARALYYPSLDLLGSVGPECFDTPTGRKSCGDGDGWLWERQGSVLIKQMLFDGNAVGSEVERQQARVKAAASRVVERSEFIALDVVQAYLDILRLIDLVRFAEANVTAHAAISRDIQRRVRAGRSGIGDQRQTEARMAVARAELVRTQRLLDDARSFYRRLVGFEALDLKKPTLAGKLVPADLQGALDRTAATNPSISAALRDIEAAEARARGTSASFWPRLDLEMSASQGHNIDGLQGDNDSYSALIVARWNLYSGGGDTARRKAALERVVQARDRMRKIKIGADEETRRSWTAMIRSTQQIEILGQRLAGTVAVLDVYRQQFTVGQRDLLDVLDAQNDVFIAQSLHATAKSSAQFAGYRVIAIAGELLSALKIADPAESVGGRPTGKNGMDRPGGKSGTKKKKSGK